MFTSFLSRSGVLIAGPVKPPIRQLVLPGIAGPISNSIPHHRASGKPLFTMFSPVRKFMAENRTHRFTSGACKGPNLRSLLKTHDLGARCVFVRLLLDANPALVVSTPVTRVHGKNLTPFSVACCTCCTIANLRSRYHVFKIPVPKKRSRPDSVAVPARIPVPGRSRFFPIPVFGAVAVVTPFRAGRCSPIQRTFCRSVKLSPGALALKNVESSAPVSGEVGRSTSCNSGR